MKILIVLLSVCMLSAACLPVSGDHILAGDLARAVPAFARVPAEEFIGFSPVPGYQRVFSTRQLIAIGSRFGLLVDPGAEACFERATELLDVERVLAAMRNELGPGGPELRIVDLCRHRVPKGSLTFSLSGLMRPVSLDPESPVLWKGEIRDDSGHVTPVWAKVVLVEEGERVVAAGRIAAGETISPGQVRLERARYSPFAQISPAVSDIIGLTARVALRPGQVLMRTDVKAPDDVKRGDTVRVTVISAGSRIQFSAQARSSGRIGQWVVIASPTNRKTLRALVEAPGSVAFEVH